MLSRTKLITGATLNLSRSLYYPVLSQKFFSTVQPRLQTPTKEPSTKRPLSRIPIGSKEPPSKVNKAGSIEFDTWKGLLLSFAIGGVLVYYFRKEKKRLETEKEAEANRGYGKPAVGGPFELVDFNGNEFTEKNLLGGFSIIYFGFSRCPDICPDELDKLSLWLDGLKQKGIELKPIFITCDPARDSPEILKQYLSEFHPDIIGLTGTYEQVKNACKQYRVYFSTPPNIKPGQDYLVDHSIFFYLMDPEGKFIDVLGRQYDEKTGIARIEEHVKAFVPQAERVKRKEKWYSFLFN
ncbi:HGL279Cp [Eremothecium sinecaudum]|uniref:HGL279Cp n=1 Tax=Eremothecium sinecaudum TaxID=45286 RepID=A0A0X8HUM5_9SACH|nr:HGL279Cp [Eremothecium sinecaudum]AMD22061.1 HGL279Cp [Eremothecium sinecaudum]